MTLSESISEALGRDALDEALQAAKAHIKAKPSDQDARHLYIDLLILTGDYERADNQCGLAATFAPEATMGFALLRNMLRGMAAREAWFATGAVPEFPGGPSDLDKLALRIGIANRTGDSGDTQKTLALLEEQRGELAMTWNGKPVSDFRDLDDRMPHALEVIMSGGGYLWVDFSKIAAIAVEPIARPRDLAFRSAELSLTDGAVASVLIPAIYPGSGSDDKLRLGRETLWVEEPTGITTGRGQRCFLAGDDLVSFHDMQNLEQPQASSDRKAGKQTANG
ncbi:type VI secretion system accessory protein TagJ [Rhizobium tumorigenes]|uniref:type VI secretion system accessory protein TagJ n=1 Tax=Rhizobium tumorigenes TaxID=2041385 RepID=UPI00241BEF69|nr:type VI secretion system accessory protein TagJ [Rhizobium tumorigenes]WFS04181.1 type VI secretion system accessory protein TagJ [Rhizobium tumorigenes]